MITETGERNFLLGVLLDFPSDLEDWVLDRIPATIGSHEKACLYIEITRVLWFEAEKELKNIIAKLITEYSK